MGNIVIPIICRGRYYRWILNMSNCDDDKLNLTYSGTHRRKDQVLYLVCHDLCRVCNRWLINRVMIYHCLEVVDVFLTKVGWILAAKAKLTPSR